MRLRSSAPSESDTLGYVLHILLALATLAAPETGAPVGAARPWAVVLLGVIPYLLFVFAKRALLYGKFRRGAFLERLVTNCPPLLQLAAVVGLGWLTTLEGLLGTPVRVTGWPGLELLAGIAPFMLYSVCAIDARTRLFDLRPDAIRAGRAFQLRLFLSGLAPFAIYLGVASLIALNESLQVHIEEVSLLGAGFSTLLLLSFVLILPAVLANTWDTVPLEPSFARSVLERVATQADFRCRDLLVWRTGNQMANAAIVGFTPKSRVVLFSDALLAHLGTRELAAVFAHEIGHAKRNHAAAFASFALALFLGADWTMERFEITSPVLSVAILGGVLVFWYLSFGFLSRRFELQADLESLRLLGEARPLIQALEQVTGAHAHERSSWRHFSTGKRARFLERVEADPEVGERLERGLRRWSVFGYALFAIVGVLQLVELGRALPADRLVADLRLGHYDEAKLRLGRIESKEADELNERLSDLVRFAAAIPEGRRSPVELALQAEVAAESGFPQEVVDYLELAVLRGASELEVVLEAVDQSAESGEAIGSEQAALLPEPWNALLAPETDSAGEAGP